MPPLRIKVLLLRSRMPGAVAAEPALAKVFDSRPFELADEARDIDHLDPLIAGAAFDLIVLESAGELVPCRRDVRRLCARYRFVPIIVVGNRISEEAEASLIVAGADEVLEIGELEEAHSRRSIVAAVLRARRERALSGEERADLALRGTDAGIWDRDLRTNEIYFSPRWKSMLGYAEDQIPNQFIEWESRLHPEDRDRVLQAIRDHLEGRTVHYEVEYRLRHADGSYRWILSQGGAIRDPQGRPYRIVGLHFDITKRKETEDSLREEQRLMRDVLELLENDRKLIGYEIHDGFIQEAIAGMFHLEAAGARRGGQSAEAEKELQAGVRLLKKSVKEARRLISGLRPPVLEEAGVVAAIGSHIEELRQERKIDIAFTENLSSERLATLTETAIYRIVQEALNNARRHSKSLRIAVELMRLDDSLHIEIRDWGVGFNPQKATPDHFGLRSICDRARLLGGHASIDSSPGCGTRIVVDLPLAASTFPRTPGRF